MSTIDIGKITDFANFNNANDGIALYKKDKINMTYYEFIKDGILLWFNVFSTRNIIHNTKLSINTSTEKIIECSCSCNYKNTKNDKCKHIVAGYVSFINSLKESLSPNYNYDFSYLDTINKLPKSSLNIDENIYSLSYLLHIISPNKLKVELKLSSSNKCYSILNIKDFLNSILKNESFFVNKTTSFNLKEENFNENDRKFISNLVTIYSLMDLDINLNESFLSNSLISLNEKLLHILLNIVSEENLSIQINDEIFSQCKIINEDLDISPSILTDDSNNIILSIDLKNIIRLFDNSPYFYFDGNIYVCSFDFVENYSCLKTITLNNNTSYFKINDKNKNSFLNQTLPKLSKNFNLKISDSLNDNIKIENCITKFYIDKTVNDIILIKVVFNYGDVSINPLDTSLSNTNVLRNFKLENEILITLNNLCENQSSLYYLIKSPDKIINFKENGLTSLKSLGEVYYTKNFKRYKIINSSSYKTSFKMGLNNLLNISFSFDGITNDELYSAIKSIRKGEKYLKLKDKGILNLDNDYLKEIDSILYDLDINENKLKEDSLSINKFYAFYLNNSYSKKFNSLGELNKDDNFLKIAESITNLKNTDLTPPKNLNANLRSYQLEGFKWLKLLKEYNLSGILADEMGLGKTIQTITFLQKEYENKELKNAIIICPKSLIYNWYEEIKKFAPNLRVLIFNGNKNARLKLLEEISNYDVILASYGIIQKDIDSLKDKNFNICILDEAQNIKNKSSKNTLSLKKLNINYKFALTGTPIENSLDELWSIFNFLMPGYLYSYSKFKSVYENLSNNSNLSRKISPFILRRLKKNVLTELPPKIETKIMIDLNDEQKKLYYSYIEKFRNEFDDEKYDDKNLKFKMLSALTRLRQICCDPKVLIEDYSCGSSKIDTLMEIVENNIKNNKKIIVFSNFTTVLNIIRKKFEENNIKYTYLDGSTPSKERLDIVNDFNKNDYNVFLISLKAGGFGLNITSAEVVIHFDPWWNNAVENQATDRAHRIGQKNTIHVIKLITKGTIEEKIFEIQERKNNLINSIIKDSSLEYNSILKMSANELKTFFFSNDI